MGGEGTERTGRQTTVSVVKGEQLVEQLIKKISKPTFKGNCLKVGDETHLCCLNPVKMPKKWVYSVEVLLHKPSEKSILDHNSLSLSFYFILGGTLLQDFINISIIRVTHYCFCYSFAELLRFMP